MNKIQILLISLFVLIFCIPQILEAQFILSGEYRFRGELNHGYKTLPVEGTNPAAYISQRTRLNAGYKKGIFSTRLAIQDVRMWGGEDIASKTGVWGDSTGIDLCEAWVNIKIWEHGSVKLGRQFLNYDDQRMLSSRNWNQFALSYDALLFKYLRSSWQIDIGLSWNNKFNRLFGQGFGTNSYYDDGWRIKSINYLYLKKKFNKSSVSFSVIGSGLQKPGSTDVFYFKITYGPYLRLVFGEFDIMLNAFGQNGHDADGHQVTAYMFSVNTGYQFNPVRIGAGIDYISGEDASNKSDDYLNKNHTFDLLYGARFKFYGWMNEFLVLSNNTKNGGLIDVYPNLIFNITAKHELKIFYHLFFLQNKVSDKIDPNTYYDKALGSELDLMYNWGIIDEITLQAGFSWYFTSETMDAFKLGYDENNEIVKSTSPYWAWLMLIVKPTLFTSK